MPGPGTQNGILLRALPSGLSIRLARGRRFGPEEVDQLLEGSRGRRQAFRPAPGAQRLHAPWRAIAAGVPAAGPAGEELPCCAAGFHVTSTAGRLCWCPSGCADRCCLANRHPGCSGEVGAGAAGQVERVVAHAAKRVVLRTLRATSNGSSFTGQPPFTAG